MSKERLLDELAEKARKSLPRGEAESLVAEARDHLDAAIAARLELETPTAAAEIESVAAFGSVDHVVRRAVAVRRGRWHTPVLALLTLLGSGWLPLALSSENSAFSLAVLAFLALIVPFAMACESRRPRRSLVASATVFWLLSTGLLASVCGPYEGYPTGRGTLTGIADFYAGHADARFRREAKYDRLGWPTAELRNRTQRDRTLFASMSAAARRASRTVDLATSARLATLATTAFALYLALLYALGAGCERLAARESLWSRCDFWRSE